MFCGGPSLSDIPSISVIDNVTEKSRAVKPSVVNFSMVVSERSECIVIRSNQIGANLRLQGLILTMKDVTELLDLGEEVRRDFRRF